REAYCRMVTSFHRAKRNVLIVQDDMETRFGKRERIDLWWGGLNLNGGLMMILAYLLQTSYQWRGARVTLKMVVEDESAIPSVTDNLASIVKRARTGAHFEIIPARDRAFIDIFRESSADADLIFMGLAEPQDDFELYYRALRQQSAGMPPTLYVLAAEDLAFGEVLLKQ
ncbi:MAG: Na-K-Cl cotransporter, partial [Thermoanaerobaculia bacterium]|nr:Na-K-Cl cotransporter [Thermoanaerobaculia bacterium]